MRYSFNMRLGLLLGLLVAACGGPVTATEDDTALTVVDNPSGTCVAPDDGARLGYHSPGDDVWLPDCQKRPAREYWRIFARDAAHAYLVPRPDGAPELSAACTNPTHPLHLLVARYTLCTSASSPERVERVNSMSPVDALAVSRELHANLRFTQRADNVSPFPLPSDVLGACELASPNGDPTFESLCARERERLASGNLIGFAYDGPAGAELARRLNELYGVESSLELPCVQYIDGLCDAAARCSVGSVRRVECAAACDVVEKSYPSCTRGGTEQVCLVERASGDLYAGADLGAADRWRDCDDDERARFERATR